MPTTRRTPRDRHVAPRRRPRSSTAYGTQTSQTTSCVVMIARVQLGYAGPLHRRRGTLSIGRLAAAALVLMALACGPETSRAAISPPDSCGASLLAAQQPQDDGLAAATLLALADVVIEGTVVMGPGQLQGGCTDQAAIVAASAAAEGQAGAISVEVQAKYKGDSLAFAPIDSPVSGGSHLRVVVNVVGACTESVTLGSSWLFFLSNKSTPECPWQADLTSRGAVVDAKPAVRLSLIDAGADYQSAFVLDGSGPLDGRPLSEAPGSPTQAPEGPQPSSAEPSPVEAPSPGPSVIGIQDLAVLPLAPLPTEEAASAPAGSITSQIKFIPENAMGIIIGVFATVVAGICVYIRVNQVRQQRREIEEAAEAAETAFQAEIDQLDAPPAAGTQEAEDWEMDRVIEDVERIEEGLLPTDDTGGAAGGRRGGGGADGGASAPEAEGQPARQGFFGRLMGKRPTQQPVPSGQEGREQATSTTARGAAVSSAAATPAGPLAEGQAHGGEVNIEPLLSQAPSSAGLEGAPQQQPQESWQDFSLNFARHRLADNWRHDTETSDAAGSSQPLQEPEPESPSSPAPGGDLESGSPWGEEPSLRHTAGPQPPPQAPHSPPGATPVATSGDSGHVSAVPGGPDGPDASSTSGASGVSGDSAPEATWLSSGLSLDSGSGAGAGSSDQPKHSIDSNSASLDSWHSSRRSSMAPVAAHWESDRAPTDVMPELTCRDGIQPSPVGYAPMEQRGSLRSAELSDLHAEVAGQQGTGVWPAQAATGQQWQVQQQMLGQQQQVHHQQQMYHQIHKQQQMQQKHQQQMAAVMAMMANKQQQQQGAVTPQVTAGFASPAGPGSTLPAYQPVPMVMMTSHQTGTPAGSFHAAAPLPLQQQQMQQMQQMQMPPMAVTQPAVAGPFAQQQMQMPTMAVTQPAVAGPFAQQQQPSVLYPMQQGAQPVVAQMPMMPGGSAGSPSQMWMGTAPPAAPVAAGAKANATGAKQTSKKPQKKEKTSKKEKKLAKTATGRPLHGAAKQREQQQQLMLQQQQQQQLMWMQMQQMQQQQQQQDLGQQQQQPLMATGHPGPTASEQQKTTSSQLQPFSSHRKTSGRPGMWSTASRKGTAAHPAAKPEDPSDLFAAAPSRAPGDDQTVHDLIDKHKQSRSRTKPPGSPGPSPFKMLAGPKKATGAQASPDGAEAGGQQAAGGALKKQRTSGLHLWRKGPKPSGGPPSPGRPSTAAPPLVDNAGALVKEANPNLPSWHEIEVDAGPRGDNGLVDSAAGDRPPPPVTALMPPPISDSFVLAETLFDQRIDTQQHRRAASVASVASTQATATSFDGVVTGFADSWSSPPPEPRGRAQDVDNTVQTWQRDAAAAAAGHPGGGPGSVSPGVVVQQEAPAVGLGSPPPAAHGSPRLEAFHLQVGQVTHQPHMAPGLLAGQLMPAGSQHNGWQASPGGYQQMHEQQLRLMMSSPAEPQHSSSLSSQRQLEAFASQVNMRVADA